MTLSSEDQPSAAIAKFALAMADDEIILAHRDSEWTGHAPILEEDIAFSNIAQDELHEWSALRLAPQSDRLHFS